MRLTNDSLQNPAPWQAAGFRLPQFDRDAAARRTAEAPVWVHFGAGNIFRAFPAALQQTLLEQGAADHGIVVAEGYDGEIIEKIYAPHDDLGLLVTLKADGTMEKTVIASVTESLNLEGPQGPAFARLKEIFEGPGLQMVSFTITEKGYSLTRADGSLLPDVAADFGAGPQGASSYMGKLTALCHARFLAGGHPLALVSMDNCSHNGDRLRDAVTAVARAWAEGGLVPGGFPAWLEDGTKVSFPWSMIDKITPRPDEGVMAALASCGFQDAATVVTGKNTFIAPFVNSEEMEYLVIEDHFPNGRPRLEKAGVIFTTRETVDKTEKMKVCTCLNPLHTVLAVFGCLLGYTKISDQMKDRALVRLVEEIGYREGLPVVADPGILNPREFLDAVLRVRLPNPFLPDTPQRIATDTSQKLSIRFGETIKAYQARPDLDLAQLRGIPLALAAWCRYLLGVDDEGTAFQLSPDPLLGDLLPHLEGLALGQPGPFGETLRPILSDPRIFGVDLYQVGLGQQVEEFFARMVSGPGAVRATLEETVDKFRPL